MRYITGVPPAAKMVMDFFQPTYISIYLQGTRTVLGSECGCSKHVHNSPKRSLAPACSPASHDTGVVLLTHRPPQATPLFQSPQWHPVLCCNGFPNGLHQVLKFLSQPMNDFFEGGTAEIWTLKWQVCSLKPVAYC